MQVEISASVTPQTPEGLDLTFPCLKKLSFNGQEQKDLNYALDLFRKCQFPDLKTIFMSTGSETAPPEHVEKICAFLANCPKLAALTVYGVRSWCSAVLDKPIVLPRDLWLHFRVYDEMVPKILAQPVEVLHVEDLEPDPDARDFLWRFFEHGSNGHFKAIQIANFQWSDSADDEKDERLVGNILAHALRLEKHGIKLLDCDGCTFRDAVAWQPRLDF